LKQVRSVVWPDDDADPRVAGKSKNDLADITRAGIYHYDGSCSSKFLEASYPVEIGKEQYADVFVKNVGVDVRLWA
jgi:hypothetical protein